jgi:mono/diheme cytochrome c family protein
MRGVLKWIGIIIGGLLLAIIVAVAAAYVIAEERLNRTYEVTVEEIPIPDQPSGNLDEWPLMLIEFCEECHGPDMAGQVLDDDPLFGTLISANLTSGEGGIGDDHTDADFVRALRHGIDHDGTPLIVMPSQSIGLVSDRDLAELIAYVKNLPPVDNEVGETRLGLLGRVFLVAGQIPDLIPAEIIDHDAERPASPEPGETAEYEPDPWRATG